jgi:transcriptional regulator with XRE-family HTH domain
MAASAPKVLALVRESRRWTQEELGKRMGKGKSDVSRIESGQRRLDLATLDQFLGALELSWRRFFRLLGLVEEVEAELTRYPAAKQTDLPFAELREAGPDNHELDLGGWDDPEVESAARSVTHALGDYQRILDKVAIRRLLSGEKATGESSRQPRRSRRRRSSS